MTTRIIDNDKISRTSIHRPAFAARALAMSAVAALSLFGMSGCVAEFGDDMEDGAYLDEEDVDSSEHMVYHGQRVQIKAVHSLKCAEIAGASPYNGAALVQWDCWGGLNQRFYTYLQPDGYWTIVAAHTGKCLELANIWSNATVARQNNCNGSDIQKFSIEYSIGSYFIRPKSNGKCLDVSDYSLSNGTNIIQWTCNSMLNQRFYIDAA